MSSETISIVTIPLFSGAIGYVTNWTGIWMLFNPLRFRGIRIPGLQALAGLLPRRVQQIPGVMQGGVGWQGIIPSRAAKMGSISVDKGIAKLGSASDFYRQLDPDLIAEHILATSQRDIRDLVERTMAREHPRLWNDLPPRIREAVHARVRDQLPEIVHELTDRIGENIDQLLDIKLMVIRRMEQSPELCNRVFTEVGNRELRFIVNSARASARLSACRWRPRSWTRWRTGAGWARREHRDATIAGDRPSAYHPRQVTDQQQPTKIALDRVRVQRLHRDAMRPMATNLAEGIALSHALLRFVGVAHHR